MPYDPSYAAFVRAGPILDVIARERPDVLEIHSPYVAAYAALRANRDHYGVRTFQWHSDFLDTYAGVFTARSQHPARMHAALRGPLALGWAWVRRIGRACDATLVSAAWQMEKLRAHGVPHLAHVPFGVERFGAGVVRGEGAPKNAAPAFYAVGRQAIEKRWDVAIDAFCTYRERAGASGVGSTLVFLGDGPERARLEARAAASAYASDIRFLGFERDRARYAAHLDAATALLHACPYETFGLAVAEGLARGVPAIVPAAGGAGELVDASVGETYPPLDANACADAIARFVARDRGPLVAAAHERARTLPTPVAQFTAQISLYESLLAARPTLSHAQHPT